MEVWLSEFGYDTNEHSPNLAPAYGVFDAEDVQGMWIVRSFLYLALARIDRGIILISPMRSADHRFCSGRRVTDRASDRPSAVPMAYVFAGLL
jgi:hypothetical protein